MLVAATGMFAESVCLKSRSEMELFLETAEVTSSKVLSVGVTRSKKLIMTDGRITHAAHFQSVDIYKPVFDSGQAIELNFRDSYKYNIAAYRLDKLLDLGVVPVSVERRYRGQTGAFTWWVDNVAMMERDRVAKKLVPPDIPEWNNQVQKMRIFNALVYNTDANMGNILITDSWDLRLVDFTRAFRLHKRIMNPGRLTRIDERLRESLVALNIDTLRSELEAYLSDKEIDSLLARRDLIVEHFDNLTARN
jgi:hypothetical protein